jgi:hypothetical protein
MVQIKLHSLYRASSQSNLLRKLPLPQARLQGFFKRFHSQLKTLKSRLVVLTMLYSLGAVSHQGKATIENIGQDSLRNLLELTKLTSSYCRPFLFHGAIFFRGL